MQRLSLRKFNPRQIEEQRKDPNQGPPTILIIGSRRTGKTYLIEDLMYYFRKIPTGMIMTGSEASAESFSNFFPKSFIYDEVDIGRIEKVVELQTKLRKKKTDGDYSSLLIFDDCGYDRSIANKKVVRKIFCNGRHLKILFFMTLQYCKDVPPTLRTNADYVFILRDPSLENRKKLWKDYASFIKDFDTFNDIMDECTDDRGILVLNKTTISNDIKDCAFWYKARFPLKKFRVGSDSLWKFHEENYVSEPDSDEEQKNNIGKPKTLIKKIKRKKKPSGNRFKDKDQLNNKNE